MALLILRFLKHRIADKRMLRLVAKWLKVGSRVGREDRCREWCKNFAGLRPALLPEASGKTHS